jgi:hypothetical protein
MHPSTKIINDFRDVIDVLSEALVDCRAIAKANPLDRSSVSLQDICYKALKTAHEIMEPSNVLESYKDEV